MEDVLLATLRNGRLDAFKQLLEMVDRNRRPVVDLATCVHEACSEGKPIEYLGALLTVVADANLVVDVATGQAPIHVAISEMNLPAAWLLLEQATFNSNVCDQQGDTPLHYVVKLVDDEHQAHLLVRQLLEKGADVNVENAAGKSALMEAAVLLKEKMVKAMLPGNYAEKEITNGVTLKSFLDQLFPQFENVVNNYEPNAALTNTKERILFRLLYKENYVDFLAELQNPGDDPRPTEELLKADDGKNTFLQTACSLPMTKDDVKVLLNIGFNPILTTEKNRSPPLVIAAERRNYDVMEGLLQNELCKMNVNMKDAEGNTALHVVAEHRNLEMVLMLLNAGAEMDIKNNLGNYSISTAALKDFMDMSLQSEENEFKLRFSLFIQRGKAATAQPSISTQNGVEISLLDVPSEEGSSRGAAGHTEAARLYKIVQTYREECILNHPLVQSFIVLKFHKSFQWKWIKFLLAFISLHNLVIYIWGARIKSNEFRESTTFDGIVCFTYFVIEIIQIIISWVSDFRQSEKYLHVSLAIYTPLYAVAVIFWDNKDWLTIFTLPLVFLPLLEIFVISARFYNVSLYMELLKTVIKNSKTFFLWHAILVVPFPVAYVLLTGKHIGDNCCTVSNVTLEMNGTANGNIGMNPEHHVVNLLALLLVVGFSVVLGLFNFMTSLVLCDTKDITETATLQSIRTQLDIMKNMEESFTKKKKWRNLFLCTAFLSADIRIFTEDDKDEFVCIKTDDKTSLFIGKNKERIYSIATTSHADIMKIVGYKSFTTANISKADAQMTAKSEMQDLLQDNADGRRQEQVELIELPTH